MTSKQRYIEQMRQKALIEKTTREIYQVTPEVYAAFALVLDGRGWTHEEIAKLFADTQDLWNESVANGTDMVKNCEEVTGILLMQNL